MVQWQTAVVAYLKNNILLLFATCVENMFFGSVHEIYLTY